MGSIAVRWQRWCIASLGVPLLIVAGCGDGAAGSAAAPAPPDDRNAVLTALAVFPLAVPDPVLAADGQVHLAYELIAMNQSSATVTLQEVQVLDAADGRVLDTMAGDALRKLTRFASGSDTAFGPGGSGYVFVDVSLPPDGAGVRTLAHRITMSLAAPGDQPSVSTITGVPVQVSSETAVVVAPPLRGDGWLVGSGCCDAITSHRGATLSIDGTVHAPERFAIDFVQVDAQGRYYTGDVAQNASFPFFGAEIHSVAPGTVVAAVDGLPENVPGNLPDDATVQTAGGNHVVVDIGAGRYAFYAHLQPGSLRVTVGQLVETGTVLGLLGNSGNSDAPHLHFHVMDGPSPLRSNGLPFRFTRFDGQGRATADAPLAMPVVTIDSQALAGSHVDQLPLNLQIVRFP